MEASMFYGFDGFLQIAQCLLWVYTPIDPLHCLLGF